MGFAASAQGTTPPAETDVADIHGFFRVQSAFGNENDEGFVNVTGPFTVAPNATIDQARTSAGSVMRLRAFKEDGPDNKVRYKIANLSSQGIEVIGAPKAVGQDAVNELMQYLNGNDYVEMAYSLQRQAAEQGYISTGRTLIMALFEVVAERLDSEITALDAATKEKLGYTADSESLKTFAQRFNEEVSMKLDLDAYLEPVNEEEGTYRLYFNWINCAPVSEFYRANEQNKKSFELGFECMRHYLSGKQGLGSGEYIDLEEVALWKEWGYDLLAEHPDLLLVDNTYYQLSYEQIFNDHEILYNWLKMYIERFLDPAKAPDASILGINFKAFAEEMQRHAIMQGFLKYIPSIQENQKLYLTDGRFSSDKNEFSTVGTTRIDTGHFGLLDAGCLTTATDAETASIWYLRPMEDSGFNTFVIEPTAARSNHKDQTATEYYSAKYFDFTFEPIESNMEISLLEENNKMDVQDEKLQTLGNVKYVDLNNLDKAAKANRRTAVFIKHNSKDAENNNVHLVYESLPGDYIPELNINGLKISDEYVTVMHSARRAATGETTTQNSGVLLASNVKNTGITIATGESAHVLETHFGKNAETDALMESPWLTPSENLPANSALIVAKTHVSDGEKQVEGLSLGMPEDETKEVVTGIEDVNFGTSMENDTFYDLNGRKVINPEHGAIYILNGKKVVVL